MKTAALFERYYFSRPDFTNGTAEFQRLCDRYITSGSDILEIGAGGANPVSDYLSQKGAVIGIDSSDEVLENPALARAMVFDGIAMPIASATFDVCVSNYVLEHVADPDSHFAEVARVLKPGGIYLFRTPNVLHYVALASRLLPHSVHQLIANPLRGIADGHEPWPTVYRANSATRLRRLASRHKLDVRSLKMIEKEPSYGRFHPLLFYPMMWYERTVNSTEILAPFRVNILGALAKPSVSAPSIME